MDTLLLATTALLTGRQVRPWRLLSGAALGALGSCFLFFATLPPLFVFFSKILLPPLLIAASFPFERLCTYGRTVLVFLTAAILFGGGMYAFYAFTDAGSNLRFTNGVYYFNLPLWLLLALSFGFYALTRCFFHLLDQRKEKSFLHTLTIDGTDLLALLDTGNSLYDPISLLPVILCEWDAAPVPEELLRAVVHRDTSALPALCKSYPHLHLRLLPYTDATGNHTLLYAYKPKDVQIDGKERQALIALTLQNFSADNRFQALLHRDWSNL